MNMKIRSLAGAASLALLPLAGIGLASCCGTNADGSSVCNSAANPSQPAPAPQTTQPPAPQPVTPAGQPQVGQPCGGADMGQTIGPVTCRNFSMNVNGKFYPAGTWQPN